MLALIISLLYMYMYINVQLLKHTVRCRGCCPEKVHVHDVAMEILTSSHIATVIVIISTISHDDWCSCDVCVGIFQMKLLNTAVCTVDYKLFLIFVSLAAS